MTLNILMFVFCFASLLVLKTKPFEEGGNDEILSSEMMHPLSKETWWVFMRLSRGQRSGDTQRIARVHKDKAEAKGLHQNVQKDPDKMLSWGNECIKSKALLESMRMIHMGSKSVTYKLTSRLEEVSKTNNLLSRFLEDGFTRKQGYVQNSRSIRYGRSSDQNQHENDLEGLNIILEKGGSQISCLDIFGAKEHLNKSLFRLETLLNSETILGGLRNVGINAEIIQKSPKNILEEVWRPIRDSRNFGNKENPSDPRKGNWAILHFGEIIKWKLSKFLQRGIGNKASSIKKGSRSVLDEFEDQSSNPMIFGKRKIQTDQENGNIQNWGIVYFGEVIKWKTSRFLSKMA